MNTESFRFFHYSNGDIVKVDDVVRTGNKCVGKVVKIIQPLSPDAEHFNCPEGGILIEEEWKDAPSLLLLIPPDGSQWEDLLLFERSEK